MRFSPKKGEIMENYKQKIKQARLINIFGIFAIILIYIALAVFFSDKLAEASRSASFISGFQTGLSFAFVLYMIIEIVKINKALKDEEKLNVLYVEATDERSQKIQKEVESTTATIFMIILLLGTIVSGYFSSTVFFALLGALIVFVGIKAVCKFIYNKKF